jgi:hypothetical protein
VKLYKIRDWAAIFENNRSRTVKDLAWVPIPNRHDGENYSLIMAQKNASEIFAAWVLMLQVASRCHPRGSLVRDNQKPHTPLTLSTKTRAPEKWFEIALNFLEKETDWLEIEIDCQSYDSQVSVSAHPTDEEGKGTEGKGREVSAPSFSAEMAEIFNQWNSNLKLTRCLILSDKRRQVLRARLGIPFFRKNWREAISKVVVSEFCNGANDRKWKASFEWFISPDAVVKIMEGKYDNKKTNSMIQHRLRDMIPTEEQLREMNGE